MAKKRKATRQVTESTTQRNPDRYDAEEKFDDSEDEFFAAKDKILLDEGPAAKRRRRLEDQERDLQPSDEEVYQESDDEDESEADDVGDGHDEDEEEEEGNWGSSKADYYNADVIETEADALEEEQEARRLQQKQLQGMTEADFGFDESAWAEDTKQTQESRPAVEKLPELQIPENATDEERMQILKARYPEFDPLTKDFLTLQDTYRDLKKEAAGLPPKGEEEGYTPIVLTKFRALSAYLGSVALYLAVLTSSKTGMALAPGELREHPVMNNLVRCRQLWQDAESLRATEPTIVADEKPTSVVELQPASVRQASAPPVKTKKESGSKSKAKAKAKARSPSPLSEEISPDPIAAETTTKRRRERKQKRNDLQDLLTAASMQAEQQDGEESDFGDEAPLTHEEAAEKARKKKSLRFYTSQIAQKANRRGAASRNAGGDDDVPHKERLRDRQERLQREAEQRGKSAAVGREALDNDAEDDGDDYDDNDLTSTHLRDEANDYYSSLVSQSQRKKADKHARAAATAAASGKPVYEEETVDADGKRKITYAIEKNKGLTPRRKKEVRNPRVKKRMKFDEKMKKLASVRAVYKGGEARGGYGGEATGIKTHLVKSVKL